MAMTINTNTEAIHTLGLLNQNSTEAQKNLQQVATGMKINTAADNASAYAISERMRVNIRALDQAHQNIQNDSALLKTAGGGINGIISELMSLKEMAINSANDSNTNYDRAIINVELTQRIANINEIATSTSFNGKKLLDGSQSKSSTVDATESSATDSTTTTEETDTTDTTEPTTEETDPTEEADPADTEGDATVIYSGNYTIAEDGVYSLASGYTGKVTINAQNVTLTQETPGTALNNVYIVGPSGGNAKLTIENLNIVNPRLGYEIIKFQNSNNQLTIKGTNTLDNNLQTSSTYAAAINIGKELTIKGDGSLTARGSNGGAAIGGNGLNSVGKLKIIGDVTINATSINGAAIGSGFNGHINTILIAGNAKVTATSTYGAAIGTGSEASVENIQIGGNATITATSNYGAGIGTGTYLSDVLGIIRIGGNAKVTARSSKGAGIGCSFARSSVLGSIIISSTATVNASTTNTYNIQAIGASIASRPQSHVDGRISIGETAFDIDGNNPAADNPTPGNPSSDDPYDTNTGNNSSSGKTQTGSTQKFIPGLRFQNGTSPEEFFYIFIENMQTKSLGTGKLFDANGNLINGDDINRYNALDNDATKQAELLATLKAAENKTLDDISVTTKDNANIAIRVIDGAIEYAINQAANLGAMENRLGYIADNLITENENAQASDSAIRDADISKTMIGYAKYNLLTRLAQEMLTQANQNSKMVFSLLS